MRFTKPYRGQRGSKRLDLTDLRELVRDRRLWCSIGKATVPDGETTHITTTDTDILIDVVLHPSLQDVTCRLAAGMWIVPSADEEVVVVMPEGEMAFMPTIVAILSTGTVPSAQQPSATRIAIVRQEVVVHDGPGGANPLPTLASLQATIDKLNTVIDHLVSHTHTGGTLAGGVTGPPAAPLAVETHAGNAVGTTVLKGK